MTTSQVLFDEAPAYYSEHYDCDALSRHEDVAAAFTAQEGEGVHR